MPRMPKNLFCFVLMAFFLLHLSGGPAAAGEKQDRIRLLQEKMKVLQEQLAVMQEARLREQPPTAIPWQPIQASGDERKGYAQYVYLLGSQMGQDDLDAVLQQVYYLASNDSLEERGTLFVVPALPLAGEAQMSIDAYDRELAVALLARIGIPSAVEGGLAIAAEPLGRLDQEDRQLLFIDLSGCDRVLRTRILELLQARRLFGPDGTIHDYLWELLKSASPQSFKLFWQKGVAWLSVGSE